MAISPMVKYSASSPSAGDAAAAKVKALSIAKDAISPNDGPNRDTEPDLSEQLNEKTKNKYVKGMVLFFFPPSESLISAISDIFSS